MRRRARGEHGGDPREQHHEQHRLGAIGCCFARVVPQGGEHRPRPLQNEQRPQPPVAHRGQR